MGVQAHQVAIRDINYDFDFINSASWWVTMVPEGHGAQVLPDPDLGSKRWPPPLNWGGALQFLLNKVFAKMPGWGYRGPPDPLYAAHTQGWAPGHFFDGHFFEGTYFRPNIFSTEHIFDRTYFRPNIFSTSNKMGHIFDNNQIVIWLKKLLKTEVLNGLAWFWAWLGLINIIGWMINQTWLFSIKILLTNLRDRWWEQYDRLG